MEGGNILRYTLESKIEQIFFYIKHIKTTHKERMHLHSAFDGDLIIFLANIIIMLLKELP